MQASKAIVLTLSTLLCACARPESQQFDWLLGCWESTRPNSTITERWTKSNGEYTGVGKVMQDGKRVVFETLVIRPTVRDAFELVASPVGERPTVFLATVVSHRQVMFEDLDHDFPQRIMYRSDDDEMLHARLEGRVDGQQKSADFPMRRVDCDAR